MIEKSKIDNPEFVPVALYRIGGIGRFVDVEDVFVECWKMAPERFGWRRHDFPNYKVTSKALRDLEDRRPNLLLKTDDGLARQLTGDGMDWVRKRLRLFEQLAGNRGENPPTRRPSQRLLNEIRDHRLFQSYQNGTLDKPAKHEVADLLMCSPDSSPEIWRERLETYRAAAADVRRNDIREFLNALELRSPRWFGGQE